MASGDISVIESAFAYLPDLVAAPLAGLIILILVYTQIGNTVFIGLTVMVAYLLLQLPIQALLHRLRTRISEAGDSRLGLMTRLVEGIRTVKAAVWEEPMLAEVERARATERKAYTCFYMISAITDTLA